MLQPLLLGLLIRNLTQRLKLLGTHPTHTQPRLSQHLHILQGTPRLAQLAELLEADLHGKLLAEGDVDEVPFGLLFRC